MNGRTLPPPAIQPIIFYMVVGGYGVVDYDDLLD